MQWTSLLDWLDIEKSAEVLGSAGLFGSRNGALLNERKAI